MSGPADDPTSRWTDRRPLGCQTRRTLLEPDAVKVARPVLRRARRREAPGLSDHCARPAGAGAETRALVPNPPEDARVWAQVARHPVASRRQPAVKRVFDLRGWGDPIELCVSGGRCGAMTTSSRPGCGGRRRPPRRGAPAGARRLGARRRRRAWTSSISILLFPQRCGAPIPLMPHGPPILSNYRPDHRRRCSGDRGRCGSDGQKPKPAE